MWRSAGTPIASPTATATGTHHGERGERGEDEPGADHELQGPSQRHARPARLGPRHQVEHGRDQSPGREQHRDRRHERPSPPDRAGDRGADGWAHQARAGSTSWRAGRAPAGAARRGRSSRPCRARARRDRPRRALQELPDEQRPASPGPSPTRAGRPRKRRAPARARPSCRTGRPPGRRWGSRRSSRGSSR